MPVTTRATIAKLVVRRRALAVEQIAVMGSATISKLRDFDWGSTATTEGQTNAVTADPVGIGHEQTFGVDHARGEFGQFPDVSEPLPECLLSGFWFRVGDLARMLIPD